MSAEKVNIPSFLPLLSPWKWNKCWASGGPMTYSHLAARPLWDVMAINSIWASLIHIFPSSPRVLNHHFSSCQHGLWWPNTTRVTMCSLSTLGVYAHVYTYQTQIIKPVIYLNHTAIVLVSLYCSYLGWKYGQKKALLLIKNYSIMDKVAR